MMELTCAYIFLLLSVVSATPHGYGIKGGASAKAEASATAGAIGDIKGLPLSIPSGSGFSGSYSKSSSSSFSSASSSASSSSSSFSYSGSGSAGLNGFGANGLAGANSFAGDKGFSQGNSLAGSNGLAGANGYTQSNGLAGANGYTQSNGLAGAHGHALAGASGLAGANGFAGANAQENGLTEGSAGCGSGACSNNKENGIPSLHGSDGVPSNQGYHGANAAAGSHAEAGSYGITNGGEKSCVGGGCTNPSSGCGGSDCSNIDKSNEPHRKDDDCSSGKCGNVPQSGPPSSNYQFPTQCTSGQCGINVQSNLPTQPTFESNDIPAKKYDTTSSTQHHPAGQIFNGYNGASSHSNTKSSGGIDSLNHSGNLNIHNQGHGVPKCESPNCNVYGSTAATSSPDSGLSIGHTKPSTYLTTPKEESPCNSPTCQFNFGTNTGKPTSYNVPLHTTLEVPKEDLPCNNGLCGNNQFKNPYPTSGAGSSSFGLGGSVGCTSPNCAKQPSSSSTPDCSGPHCAPSYAPVPTGSGSGLTYQPGLPGSPSITTNPSYVSPVIPSYKPTPHGHYKPDCKAPHCTGHVGAGSDSGAHSQGGFLQGGSSPTIPSYSTPILIPSTPIIGHSTHSPGYTGNHGAIGGTTAITPEHIPPTGSYSQGFGGPPGILKPNDFSVPTYTHAVPPSPAGHTNVFKPSIGSNPSAEDLPPYTGGFGGPQGILKPNEFDIKHPSTLTPASGVTTSSHDLPTYTGGFSAPGASLKPNEISSSANAGAAASSNTGSYGTASPNTGISTTSQKVPLHHGSYGSPTGTLRPGVDIGITPVVHVGAPVVLQPIPAVVTHHQALPSHTGGFIAPIASAQPNTYFSTHPDFNSHTISGDNSHGHHEQHGHSHLLSENNSGHETKYTGGFGGAPGGVLKPSEIKDSSTTSYNKPETPSSTKPAACSSGTCNGVSSNAVAVAKADAVAYTGGFGGPAGLLKPYDDGKLDSKLVSGAQSGLHHSATGSEGLNSGSSGKVNGNGVNAPGHGTYGQSGATAQASAGAQASATAGATAGATSGSFGGHNAYSIGQAGTHGAGDKSGSGCGGGCGNGGYHGSGPDFGSSSALSVAKAGATGGLDGGVHGDGASAKSVASAVSGARSFGGAGSYASSSASAHSSAGYATKGGYGK